MPAVDIHDQLVCYLDWFFTQPPFLIGLPRFDKIVFARLLNFLRFSWFMNVFWVPTCVLRI